MLVNRIHSNRIQPAGMAYRHAQLLRRTKNENGWITLRLRRAVWTPWSLIAGICKPKENQNLKGKNRRIYQQRQVQRMQKLDQSWDNGEEKWWMVLNGSELKGKFISSGIWCWEHTSEEHGEIGEGARPWKVVRGSFYIEHCMVWRARVFQPFLGFENRRRCGFPRFRKPWRRNPIWWEWTDFSKTRTTPRRNVSSPKWAELLTVLAVIRNKKIDFEQRREWRKNRAWKLVEGCEKSPEMALRAGWVQVMGYPSCWASARFRYPPLGAVTSRRLHPPPAFPPIRARQSSPPLPHGIFTSTFSTPVWSIRPITAHTLNLTHIVHLDTEVNQSICLNNVRYCCANFSTTIP